MPTSLFLSCEGCCEFWGSLNACVVTIIFSHGTNVVEILNIQPKQGKAKPYQVKQVREIIVRYKLEEPP
jgi:hypothetical protein